MLLNSEASKDVFVNNSTTSFRNTVPNNLRLNEQWKVALQSVCVNASFFSNLPKAVSKTNKHFIFCRYDSYPTSFITIPENNYTRESLIEFLLNQFLDVRTATVVVPNVEVRGEELLFILTVRNCQLRINEDVCRWLNIDTNGREVKEEIGIDWYLQLNDYDNLDAGDHLERVRVVVFKPDDFFGDTQIVFNIGELMNHLPKIIKIKLGEMKQSLSSSGNHQNLAIVQFEEPNIYTNFYHEVAQKEYFPLQPDLLQTLSIRITDEEDDELRIISHNPTFVKLKFKRMTSESLILRISSRDSTDIYPENTPASFRIQLPRLMSLRGQNWQVALSSIIYPSQILIPNYLATLDLWIEIDLQDQLTRWTKRQTMNLNENRIATYQDLQTRINEKSLRRAGTIQFKIRIDRDTQRTTYVATRQMRIRMSPAMASILGSSLNQFVTELTPPGQDRFIGIADIKRCMPTTLGLYTDFTNPIVAGGKYCRLLKFIPILRDLQERGVPASVSYESHHMDFVNLPTTELQSLQFELKDGEGKPVVFEDNNNTAATFINLLFVKRM